MEIAWGTFKCNSNVTGLESVPQAKRISKKELSDGNHDLICNRQRFKNHLMRFRNIILSVEHSLILKNLRKYLFGCIQENNSIGQRKDKSPVTKNRRVINLIGVACRFIHFYTRQGKRSCYDEQFGPWNEVFCVILALALAFGKLICNTLKQDLGNHDV